jgi:hypothetical protein
MGQAHRHRDHAFGDQYRATAGPGKLQLVFTPESGGESVTSNVYDFKGKGVALARYNTDEVCSSVLFIKMLLRATL